MISTTNVKHTYDGNDNTTTFAYTFEGVESTSEIVVYLVADPDSPEDVEILSPSLYTVQLTQMRVLYPLSGPPLPTGQQLVVSREVDLTQEVDLVNGGPLDSEVIEAALDKLTKGQQQLSERIERTIAAPIYVDGEVGDLGDIITSVNADATTAADAAATATAAADEIVSSALINSIIFGGG